MYLDYAGIYQIRNILDNKIYIGSAANLRTRRNRHFSLLKLNRHYNIHLQRAFNKYGKENFVFELLITCHPDMIYFYEQQLVDQWKPEYNIRTEVATNRQVKKSEEEKKRIGDFFRGRPISDEHKRNIAVARTRMPARNETGYSGVYPSGNKFRSKFKNKHVGSFNTAKEAFEARLEVIREGGY